MAATPIAIFSKDPNAVLDYSIDWRKWLAGDSISTSTWTVGAGITQDSATQSGTVATVWLSGGTDATTYVVTNRVVTVAGRTEDRTVHIQVRER